MGGTTPQRWSRRIIKESLEDWQGSHCCIDDFLVEVLGFNIYQGSFVQQKPALLSEKRGAV